ncbi:MAG: hypothetical protein AAF701_00780 [Pseudomonadota bacterium]
MLFLLAFPIPLILAILLGLRAGRTDPQTPRDFAITGGYYLLWAIALVFTWHALWITSLIPAPWTDTVRSAGQWVLGTATIWGPVYGITYVTRALKARRDEQL